ncbi:MAG: CinA family nicotinamide mononucleotide deamidase-related protein [Pirellulales bacterium]
MRAEVIAIGDELTTGQRLDTNSQWLSERMTELGVEVAYHTTVGDEMGTNVEAFRTAIARAEIVVATGGLGPTADDLTRQALAEAVGVELMQDADSLAHIEQLFASRGRPMPERNRLQALFPVGARPIHNPNGTAPGIAMAIERQDSGSSHVFCLPGVPAEMVEMWHATVAPAIMALAPAPRVIRHKRIKCFGVGESQLEAMLPAGLIERGREPRVGITVSGATITLRITAAGACEADCFAAMGETVAAIHDAIGRIVFGEEDDELEHAVVRLLRERGQTLATSETATDGLIAGWLAAADPDGIAFAGGEFVYTTGESTRTIQDVAEEVRRRYQADFGLAVGGVEGSEIQIVLSWDEVHLVKRFSTAGHPSILKPRVAKQALNVLRLHLLGQADDY